MKKLMTFSLAALLAAAIWFTGCENDISGGDATAAGLFAERAVLETEEQAGVAPDDWTQITDSSFINIFGSANLVAVGYGAVDSSAANSVFVVGGEKVLAAYSPDGVKWTAIPNVTNGAQINGIASDDKGTFVMVASGSNVAYTSNIANPDAWKTVTGIIAGDIYGVAYGSHSGTSGRFIIGGVYGFAAYTDDKGANWTTLPDLVPIFTGTNTNIRAISAFEDEEEGVDIFLAVGGRSGPSPMPNAAAYSNTNGNIGSWQKTSNDVFCRGLAVGTIPQEGEDVPYFVGSGYDMNATAHNEAYIQVYNLPYNIWTQVPTGTTKVDGWLDSIAYGAGYFVAVGVSGQITYTSNLTGWNSVTNVPTAPGYLTGIGYGDNVPDVGTRFVSVGDQGFGVFTTNAVSAPKPKADAN